MWGTRTEGQPPRAGGLSCRRGLGWIWKFHAKMFHKRRQRILFSFTTWFLEPILLSKCALGFFPDFCFCLLIVNRKPLHIEMLFSDPFLQFMSEVELIELWTTHWFVPFFDKASSNLLCNRELAKYYYLSKVGNFGIVINWSMITFCLFHRLNLSIFPSIMVLNNNYTLVSDDKR